MNWMFFFLWYCHSVTNPSTFRVLNYLIPQRASGVLHYANEHLLSGAGFTVKRQALYVLGWVCISFLDCCHKLVPKTGWLTTAEISPHSSGGWKSEISVSACHTPKGPRENLFMLSCWCCWPSLLFFDWQMYHFRFCLLCLLTFYPCISVSSLLIRTIQ